MMKAFVDAVCGGEVPEYWDDIFDEYLELTNNETSNIVLSLLKQAQVLKITSSRIMLLCEVAIIEDDATINQMIRRLTQFPGVNPMTQKELDVHIGLAKSLMLKYDEKRADIVAMNQSGGKMTKKDWMDLIAVLSKFQGYRLDIKELSVSEFCSVYNSFKSQDKK